MPGVCAFCHNRDMLAQILICAALGLLISCGVLFVFGHRLHRGHWLLSLATIGALASLSWGLEQALWDNAPPFDASVATALIAGAIVTKLFDRWNAFGHACFTATFLAITLYLSYSALVLIVANLGSWSLIFGIVLFLLQLAAMLLLLVHTFEVIDVVCRTQWQHLAGPKYVPGYSPKVSIHVPIHREPPEMVMKTLDALSLMDYPSYEVLVIDNNTDDEALWRPVESHCAHLGPQFRFFHLLPWPGFKSGALNFALQHTAADAEFIGTVDADYLVEPHWLADLIGHFADPRVSFVQTPQDYVDSDSRGVYGKALALSYNYFFRISMATRNESNAIIFAGTMGLLRKSALEKVGGWDEWCITEDAELSLRLLDARYKSVYIDRTYGRGIMPLDYAGLRKQRFRWAFGGMQLLRIHAGKLFNPWASGNLTFAQRWGYLSGGMQWLNDPVTMAFTVLLLIGSSALLMLGPVAVQPFAGPVMFVPPLFLLFAITRFLWALRVLERCSLMQAMRALTVLLGLSCIVTLACLRGLYSREGVFLRTPKQADTARLGDSFAIVRWEMLFGFICLAMAAMLLSFAPSAWLSARAVIVVLLVWQATIFLAAMATSLWDYRARKAELPAARLSSRTFGYKLYRAATERRSAIWVSAAILLLAQLTYPANARAPEFEPMFRADPMKHLISAPSVLSAGPRDKTGAVFVMGSALAERAK